MEGNEEKSADQVLSTCLSETSDGFGDPQAIPRVGDQYQAEIPSLVVEYVPIQNSNELNGAQFVSKGENLIAPNTMFTGKDMKDLEWLGEVYGADKMDVHSLAEEQKTKMHLDVGVYYLPDSSSEAWTNAECDGFLLGLYIFGKNLILVKRFVEGKPMGDILRYYYGKFYGSSGYSRWSGCRKLRKRSVSGKKIFTGWRYQELLSRLISRVSEDCQKLFIEVSRQMEEGRISFEDYVFTVKDAVGLGNLVEAVGIGTGKRDLTRVVNESTLKKSLVPPIPTGKSCSSLSPAKIIEFLTGDFRLSKAKSRDLFWKAIWPRLLARGWHSEQPQNYSLSGSKDSLVFLIPGVKKFIKRRLVKGNHYFDSISDILKKVASEPELIEFELGAVKEISLKEESWQDPSSKGDSDNVLDRKCHQRFMQPQNSKPSPALAGFMIVDTSSVCQGQAKMRGVRLLPSEMTCASTHSGQIEKNASEVSEDKDDATDNRAGSHKLGDATSAFDDKQPILLKKCRFDLEMNAGHPDCEGSTTQQQDFSPLACGESNSCTGNLSAQRESYKNEFHFLSPVKNKSIVLQGGSSQDFTVACSFVEVSPDELKSESCKDEFPSLDKKYSHASINLSLQRVSTDTRTHETLTPKVVQSHDQTCSAKSLCPSSGSDQPTEQHNPSYGNPNIEQQYNRYGCRKSTRNRPLTRKVLEAMECGFFNTKKKRKGTGH
ncbi:uncharacterized protein LOC104426735 [Eucalyptus grandis]|uniref:SANT domain-containing protein n=2 Tax=Eucalyptus grandis TaxID=71139 RepID=A0A059A8F5_EUCGR|nr:uncharacterized protein LOC104426735 [Eucalyptus grandis]KAK3407387.1 hypothetical protein EUGRSUZ_K03453 [Eucalyptus grandis]